MSLNRLKKKTLRVFKSKKQLAHERFASFWYIRHNARRLEHLASLNLDLCDKKVLEVGAGIGYHSTFWVDRNSDLTITEVRDESVEILKERFPDHRVEKLDLDDVEGKNVKEKYEIVYCYGLLYHLKEPASALKFMADSSDGLLLLSTCVSFGNEEEVNPVDEKASSPTQASTGQGNRPTRVWIRNQLLQHFEHVYMPLTQPCHMEFPLDWNAEEAHKGKLQRAVFVASRKKLDNPLLVEGIPDKQFRSNFEIGG